MKERSERNQYSRGWSNHYDYKGMSNVEKDFGRINSQKDIFWYIAKVVFPVFVVVIIYVVTRPGFTDTSKIEYMIRCMNLH